MKQFTIENDTNNITVHATAKDAEAVPNSERFGSEATLTKIAAEWSMARLVEVWNSLPGVAPVNKFKDRQTGIARIWKAVQNLEPVVPEANVEEAKPELAAEVASEREAPAVAQEPVTEAVQPTEPVESTFEADAPAAPLQRDPQTSEATSQPEPALAVDTNATNVAPQAPDVAPEEGPSTKKATKAKTAQDGNVSAPREGSKTAQVITMLKREGGTTVDEIMTAMSWQKHTTRSMLSAGGSLVKQHGLVIVSEKVGDQKRYSIKA